MTNTICGADVHDPATAAHTLAVVAETYGNLHASIDQSHSNQIVMGVSGPPVEMLAAMKDAVAVAVAAARAGAAEADRQAVKVADSVGADPSLAGTQAGGWMDPAAL